VCGVIGLAYERHREDLGVIADTLLRTLEYRGYDSTGAAIQGKTEEVDLRKDVGAPSQMVSKLGIDKLAGSILCAQVRWATFGAVDKSNAQPHVVRCKTYIYGAHNGNVTNCDELKIWLEEQGHEVASDNDGEMVVHTVEHYFALRINAIAASEQRDSNVRRREMRLAISDAGRRLVGSYAAVIVDPISRALWAIKRGSSLYFGLGDSAAGGKFCVTSSDLSSVLKLTRLVVPLTEGEMIEFEATRHQVYKLADASPLEKKPVRSKLRAQDTELKAPFTTFMEQEIHVQVETSTDVIRHFRRNDQGPLLSADDRQALSLPLETLRDAFTAEALRAALDSLMQSTSLSALIDRAPGALKSDAWSLGSSEKGLFGELLEVAKSPAEKVLLRAFDVCVEHDELESDRKAIDQLVDRVLRATEQGRRVFIVCCGSSFHAAKIATLFFDELALMEVLPLLPGELRGQYGRSLREGDLIIAVSQSGETKDLIDVINTAKAKGVGIVALVNNVSSTLAQEKADLVIPLRCGPEIAVAATKSFINQLTVLYCLALEIAIRRSPWSEELARRRENLIEIPSVIARTLAETKDAVEEAATLLYLNPSIHILATRIVGVALEGSLKIREVVLNHTEGFEASEFKHGRNTILGFNTTFGLAQIERLLAAKQPITDLRELLYADYPLVYVTGPDPRDVELTVSQINTHKIRGSSTVIVAEENAALRGAAMKPPSDNASYKAVYIALPKTGDPLFSAFSATVVLQTLALRMSLLKQAHLDRLGIREHGVHPDVPKNVSKSITVD